MFENGWSKTSVIDVLKVSVIDGFVRYPLYTFSCVPVIDVIDV